MRIVIDMQGAQTGSRFRGIGRYSLSLAKAMVQNSGNHEIIIALSGLFPDTIETIRAEFDDLLPRTDIRVWEGPRPVSEINPKNEWRRKAAELIREAFLQSLQPDFLLLTSLFEGYGDDFVSSIGELDRNTLIATIFYDLIPFLNRDVYLADPAVSSWYDNKLNQCKKANLLLSISESSRREAIENLKIPEINIINISTASDNRFRPVIVSQADHAILLRFGLNKPFLMYTSATDWRKNHLKLIEAYSTLPEDVRSQHQLVFVGGLPLDHEIKFQEHAQKCGLSKNELVITGIVNDDEMNLLYNLCKAFVFPSWHEGFGLPVLEAMQCGKAVIGSNRSSIPEVIGREDSLFDPFDTTSISNIIEKVLTDEEFRSSLESHALSQVKKFSWDITAKRAISALEEIWHNHCGTQGNKCDQQGVYTFVSNLINQISLFQLNCLDEDIIVVAKAINQNHPNFHKPQMLVDISELVQRDSKSGIQRVVRSILREWLIDPPAELKIEPVYASKTHGYRYARQFTCRFLGNVETDVTDESVEFHSGDFFLGLDLLHPDIAVAQQAFYQHLRNHGVLVKFIVFDLLPILLPQYSNAGVSEGHEKWLNVIRRTDGVISISKSVSDEVERFFLENDIEVARTFKFSWFHLGADIENSSPTRGFPDAAGTVLETLAETLSFLAVGTLEPRKGHAQILDAFESLWQSGVDISLVIVGKQGWKVEELVGRLNSHPQFNKRLFWLEGISDEYLEKVYAACTCLIAASYGEGFGLPLIEAAQHKLPIISRNIPVFREVAGEYAFYFDGKEPQQLAEPIKEWLSLYNNGSHPRSDDMPWLTWKESAEMLQRLLLNTHFDHYKKGELCEFPTEKGY